MSLRYILGKAGTGKTSLCIDEISQNSFDRIFYIVPEQFTLESEKNLLVQRQSLININVLGFKHLAYYLISKNGTGGRKILDDTARVMLIKRIVLEVRDKLEFYKSSADKQGFIDSLDETITELMQYDISDEKLSLLISDMKDGNLKEKLKDIRIIFYKYREYLEKSYILSDGILDVISDLIKGSELEGSCVWIDGFKSFTPQENRVIKAFLKSCKKVSITLPLNSPVITYGNVSPIDENYEVKKAVSAITRMAEDSGTEIENVIFLNKGLKKYNSEIEYLKDNYFRYRLTPYNKSVNNIKIYKAANMYDEIEGVCQKIKALVMEKGMRYSDIGLIAGSSEYNAPLSLALKKYEIPNFLDGRKSITSHPLVKLVEAAVDITAYGWDNSSVFSFLKTGYTDIPFEDIFVLERYVYANGINKYKWKREWKYGFQDEKHAERPKRELIEGIKSRLFEIMSPLNNSFNSSKKAGVREITEAIFMLMENTGVKEKIENSITEAKAAGDNLRAAFNDAVWNTLIEAFEKIVEILGDEKVTLKEYSKIIKAGINRSTAGIAPASGDYLIVGNMELTRFPDLKAMFIIGANEGNIPAIVSEKGIFTDDERAAMKNENIELAPDTVQKMNNGRLGIYINLIKASHILALSYSTGSIKGSASPESSVIKRIKTIFPKIIEEEFNNDISSALVSREAAFEAFVRAVSANDCSLQIGELYDYFINDEVYKRRIDDIKKGLISSIPPEYIASRLMPVIWRDIFSSGSVSKLEKFTQCPFAFYMNYVLRAKENEAFVLKSSDIGIIAHKVMEAFSKHIRESNMDWSCADRKYTDSFAEKYIAEFIQGMKGDIFESNRNREVLKRIEKAIKLSLWANVEQIKAGRFRPESFEISFGRSTSKLPAIEIEVDKGKILRLNGVIDRVDKMLADDGKVYVKIVDYKSSSNKLDISKIYNGLQLQLVLYMNAIVEKEKAEPGGMFYFRISEPDIIKETDKMAVLANEDYMLYRMALNGMYDESMTDDLDCAKIEIMYNKKPLELLRDISRENSTLLKKEDLSALVEYSHTVVRKIGKEMAKGNMEISPCEYDGRSACDYCPYGCVCDIVNSEENRVRKITQADEDKIWNEIRGEADKE